MNFDFARPWALLLLPLVPLALWAWRRRPRPGIVWPGAAQLAPLAATKIARARTAFRGIALIAAALALAGPRQALPGDRLDAEGIAIMLVVDVSGSMAEPDFDRNGEKIPRLTALKEAFAQFVERRPQDRIGLVFFATLPETAIPLTLDHAALLRALAAADPRGQPTENDTNLGDALAWSLDRLRADSGKKVLVVCTDGEHNMPAPALRPRQAAQLASAAGVPIFAVNAGPPNGPGQGGLDSIARMTGGQCFAANDEAGLSVACNAIDKLTRDVVVSDHARRYRYGDQPLAIAAFAALLLMLTLELGPWLRVP